MTILANANETLEEALATIVRLAPLMPVLKATGSFYDQWNGGEYDLARRLELIHLLGNVLRVQGRVQEGDTPEEIAAELNQVIPTFKTLIEKVSADNMTIGEIIEGLKELEEAR